MEKNYFDISKNIEVIVDCFSGKNYWETIPSYDLNLNGMYLADGGHGIRKQMVEASKLGLKKGYPATVFPSGTALASTFNYELVYEVGACIAEEATYYKVNVVLAPSMNIKRNPLCGRNFEYFSEDPYLTGKLAGALSKGIESKGIASCLKHYCLNNQETNRFNCNVLVDKKALNDIYLLPFKIAIKEGNPSCVMTSYNSFNGEHVNESSYLMLDKLRNEFNFKGVVISDWGAIDNRVASFKVTNDLEMPSSNSVNDKKIYDAFIDKEITKKEILESYQRILNLDKKTNLVLMNEKGTLNHTRINLMAAEESIVLLKNARNILPLTNDDRGFICGNFAFKNRIQGGGSSTITPIKREQIVDIYKEYSLNIVKVLKGFSKKPKSNYDGDLLRETINYIKIMKPKYIIAFIGLTEDLENEGVDRKSFKLPANQVNFIREIYKYNVKIIGVLTSGSAVYLKDVLDYLDALVYVPLIGMESSRAIFNILTGATSPSGRLSETWAKDYIDYPNSNIYLKETFDSNNSLYKESVFIGYRYFSTFNKKVLYPFGYGLSYATYEYSDIKFDDAGVSFKVTNTSIVKSKEVVQLYVSKIDSTYLRPAKELKGFLKFELRPGETKTFFIAFDEWTFITYDEKTDKFVKEGGRYTIYLSKNVDNDIAMKNIEIDGDDLSHEFMYLNEYRDGSFKLLSDEKYLESLNYDYKLSYKEFFDKKKKVIKVNKNTLIIDLSRCKSTLLKGLIKFFIYKVNKLYKQNKGFKANNVYSGILNQPLRSLFSMSNGIINETQLDDIIYMANGNTFKGLYKFFKHRSNKNLQKKSDRY